VRSLLSGELEQTKFEDDCRETFGISSYPLFTLDKLISQLSKQVRYFFLLDWFYWCEWERWWDSPQICPKMSCRWKSEFLVTEFPSFCCWLSAMCGLSNAYWRSFNPAANTSYWWHLREAVKYIRTPRRWISKQIVLRVNLSCQRSWNTLWRALLSLRIWTEHRAVYDSAFRYIFSPRDVLKYHSITNSLPSRLLTPAEVCRTFL